MNNIEIRKQTLLKISTIGYKVNPNLPLLDDIKTTNNNLEKITNRTLCLYLIVGIACTESSDLKNLCLTWLKKEKLWESLTFNEKEFIQQNNLKNANFCNQEESLFCFLWICNLIDNIELKDRVPKNIIEYLPSINTGNKDEFVKKCKIRTKNELFEMLDYYYVLDNYFTSLNLNNSKKYKLNEHKMVYFRRMSLEWSLYKQDWDNVNMDT